MIKRTPIISRLKIKPYKCQKNKKLALKLGIQTYQILTNDDEACIPSLSSILLAVPRGFISQKLKKLQEAESLPFCPTVAAFFL